MEQQRRHRLRLRSKCHWRCSLIHKIRGIKVNQFSEKYKIIWISPRREKLNKMKLIRGKFIMDWSTHHTSKLKVFQAFFFAIYTLVMQNGILNEVTIRTRTSFCNECLCNKSLSDDLIISNLVIAINTMRCPQLDLVWHFFVFKLVS